MSGEEKRQSLRVPFQVPVRILGPLKAVDGSLGDLSRTGARLRVPLAELHLDAGSGLSDVAARVRAGVGADFEVQLHHVVLGSLLTKVAHLVRLELCYGAGPVFEIGCLFGVPLSNEETVMLGVPLPAVADATEEWLPRADVAGPVTWSPEPVLGDAPDEAPRPRPPVPSRAPPRAESGSTASRSEVARRLTGKQVLRWRGTVLPGEASRAAALPCALDEVSRTSVRVRVLRTEGSEGAAILGDDPAAAGMAFEGRYGRRVNLKITDGAMHLWTGPAEVRAVEVPQGAMRDLLLTLAFDRSLTSPELVRLGLA